MIEILLIIIAVLVIVNIFLAVRSGKNQQTVDFTPLKTDFEAVEKSYQKLEAAVKDEFSRNRDEASRQAKEQRMELSTAFRDFSTSLSGRVTEIATLQKNQLESFSTQLHESLKSSRDELNGALKLFGEQSSKDISTFNKEMKEKFDALLSTHKEINANIEARLERIRTTVEEKLASLQEDNSKKLDEMRATVDEKLQSTLEKRLGESFKLVSDRLEQVHKGLGEMQSLANGVGDLKKVLSNVKTRGVLGEYQLGALLEQILTPEQYGKDVRTVSGSSAVVEYAVKLPGRGDTDKMVWLPIDSKFPYEDYHSLHNAYEAGDADGVEGFSKSLVGKIKLFAKDIKEKYLNPPETTDFGILFLPFEGLYAEVLRSPGLFETIQRDYKIIITGPTTLAALLNSLQMGFRTLAIEKRSSEVWEVLGSVKTEFGKFGEVLEKTQKKLQEASNVIEQAGRRSRVIERKLKDVQELPQEDGFAFLPEPEDDKAE